VSSTQPLLEGRVQVDEVIRLRREIAGLEKELDAAREELQTVKRAAADSVQAIRALRKVLSPIHAAIGMVFGELSRVDADAIVADDNSPVVGASRNPSIWQDRITKSDVSGKVLQVLLDGGGPMTLQQIRIAAKTHSNTSTYLSRLIAKNWVQKLGHGTYALKEL
jgi:Transcriptional regulator, AbiEi antitoxin